MKKIIYMLAMLLILAGSLYLACIFDRSGLPRPLEIVSDPPPDGCTGMLYEFTLIAAGGAGNYGWSVTSGQLPPGLSLDSSSGIISGTPTTDGSYTFTITLTDGDGDNVHQPYTISTGAFAILTSSIEIPCPGQGFSQQLETCGGSGNVTWSFADRGNLPATVTLSANGVLSGTIQTVDTYTFTVRAVDGSDSAERQYTIELMGGFVFVTGSVLPDALTDVPYATLLEVCGTAQSFTITGGALPPGLQLNSVTGDIAGTVCQIGTGSYTFGAEAQDNSPTPQTTPERSFVIQVVPSPLTIVNPAGNDLPDATACDNYPAVTFEATGGSGSCSGNYQWTIPGILPAGINGLSIDPSTGVLNGVTVIPDPAPYTFTVQVTDQGTNETDSRTMSLRVNENMLVDTDMIIDNVRHDYYPGHLVANEIDISGDTGYLVRIDFHFDPNSTTQLIRDLDTEIQNGNAQILQNARFRVVGCCDEVFTTNFTNPPQDIDGDGRNEATARFNEVAVRDYLINQAHKGAGDTVTLRMTVQVLYEGVIYNYVNRYENVLIVP